MAGGGYAEGYALICVPFQGIIHFQKTLSAFGKIRQKLKSKMLYLLRCWLLTNLQNSDAWFDIKNETGLGWGVKKQIQTVTIISLFYWTLFIKY